MPEEIYDEEKMHRELAPSKTVIRLLKENEGATIHNYKTPSGRECYRMLTSVTAPTPRDPLLNIPTHVVHRLLLAGRLKQEGDIIIFNTAFKRKKKSKLPVDLEDEIPEEKIELKKTVAQSSLGF